ncbi:MAG: 3'-5' exonuclease, partial [Nitratireductor sp.]
DLWSALQAAAHEGECYAQAHDLLVRLLARADYEPPYEFFAHVLAGEEGRKRLLARLGEDANDPIDEFLALALEYERTHAPSLEGFLHWVERGASEIKRDMDQGRDEVRVMTVHGAKGLEAEIVFMPDTCSMPGGQHDPALIELPTEPKLLLWPVRKGDEDEVTGGARERWREEQEKEYRRLLYVAMTRARDRLYICGYRGLREPPEGCWYNLASAALLPDAVEIEEEEGRSIWRIEGEQHQAPEPEEIVEREDIAPLGRWAFEPAPREPAPSRPLSPSRLPPEGLEEPPVSSPLTGDSQARFQRGRLIHRLLQTLPDLPPGEREAAAARFLSAPAHGLNGDAQAEIAGSVARVLSDGKFADVFAPGGRAEVPVVGRIEFGGKPHLVSGQIDRLCVVGDDVLVIDYKTNRPPPRKVEEASPAYVAQMAAYRALLQRIHPGRAIRCALLWTETPALMELPPEMLDEALARGTPSP